MSKRFHTIGSFLRPEKLPWNIGANNFLHFFQNPCSCHYQNDIMKIII